MLLDARLPLPLMSLVEDAGLNASAPPQQRWLDGWMLRLSPGKAKRARCINALAVGRSSLDERLDLARRAYREAGLPMLVRITPFSQPADLDDALARRGYRSLDDTRVMVCRELPRDSGWTLAEYRVEPVGHGAFAQAVGELRASPLSQRSAHAERLANAPVPFRGFVVRHPGDGIVACAQFAIEGRLVGLYDVFTAPAVRGRGIARAVCRLLLSHASQAGAEVGYLQVEGDNAPARKIYGGLGFNDAYAYHYRTDDPEAK